MAEVLFQANFAPKESKTFILSLSEVPAAEYVGKTKVFARFVPERLDDFAWENDCIAFRMYGPACENVLVSSGIDVRCKRVPDLIIDKWYRPGNDYHSDHGEGLDCYHVRAGRGCGGLGIWQDGKMYVSRNFATWKVLANGPIRTAFELTYRAWDVGGRKVSEIKRISLDAGQHLNRIESTLITDEPDRTLTVALGLGDHNRGGQSASSRNGGWMGFWEDGDKDSLHKEIPTGQMVSEW